MDKPKVIYVDREIKKRKIKNAIREKWEDTKAWVDDNKEIVIAAIPIVGAACVACVKGAIKSKNLKKEEQLKNNYWYDRSLGHYWKLRRELTNDECVEVDRRKQNGERLADIFESLHVLD